MDNRGRVKCLRCGKRFSIKRVGSRKKYCTDKCRLSHYKEMYRERINSRKVDYHDKCGYRNCNGQIPRSIGFQATFRKKFCSPDCSYNERKLNKQDMLTEPKDQDHPCRREYCRQEGKECLEYNKCLDDSLAPNSIMWRRASGEDCYKQPTFRRSSYRAIDITREAA